MNDASRPRIAERHVRIAYTQPIARLQEAVARIGAILPRKP